MVREAGPAREGLVVGEMPDPRPGPGDVRIRSSLGGRLAVAGNTPFHAAKWAGSGFSHALAFKTIVDGKPEYEWVAFREAALHLGEILGHASIGGNNILLGV